MVMTQNANFVPSARLCALNALVHCLDMKKPLDTVWSQDHAFGTLSSPDRAFAQLMVKTVLRRLGQIDAIVASLLERPLHNSASRIQHILRLGVAQLIWLQTPPHAAVNESVEMVKSINLPKFTGLVNVVLKRISTEGAGIVQTQDEERMNTPDWLWHRWLSAYGEQICRHIARTHLAEPPLDITPKDHANDWAEKLGAHLLPTGTLRLLERSSVPALPGFDEGAWWVQDAAASIPAQLLGKIQGEYVVDLCAAPGGKTAQLLAKGARVTAVDITENRMHTLKDNLKRLNFSAECVTADALKWKPAKAPDGILLDAPCSATGTIRRHPDVAWNRTPDDVVRLCFTQQRLLNHAVDILKPGGRLVYAVCSLQPEEGEHQIIKLLENRKDVALMPAPPYYAAYSTTRGGIRTLPSHMEELGGMDGFYTALLTKVS